MCVILSQYLLCLYIVLDFSLPAELVAREWLSIFWSIELARSKHSLSCGLHFSCGDLAICVLFARAPVKLPGKHIVH
jgi:hypothetical protein